MPDIPGMWQLAKLYRAIVAALNHFHHRSYFCVPKIFIVFSIYKCTWRSVGEFDFDIKSSASSQTKINIVVPNL